MSLHTEELSMDLLEQVLSKLGLAERPAPSLEGLQTLYAAWCRKVPFDSVRKLIHLHSHASGPLPGDDPAAPPGYADPATARVPGRIGCCRGPSGLGSHVLRASEPNKR